MNAEHTTHTAASVANAALKFFETQKRPARDGQEGEAFTALKDDRPEWLRDLVYEAHCSGNMLPDDYKYQFVRDALSLIADDDTEGEGIDGDVDVYNVDLLKWASSHADRFNGYCDEAMKLREIESFMQIVKLGQYEERREVFDIVLRGCEAQAEAQNEAEESDETDSEA